MLGKAALEMVLCYRGSTTVTVQRERVSWLICLGTSQSPKNKCELKKLRRQVCKCETRNEYSLVHSILEMAGIFEKRNTVLYPNRLDVTYYVKRDGRKQPRTRWDGDKVAALKRKGKEKRIRFKRKNDKDGLRPFCKFLGTFFKIAQTHGTIEWIVEQTIARKEQESADLEAIDQQEQQCTQRQYDALERKYENLTHVCCVARREVDKVLVVLPTLTKPDTHMYVRGDTPFLALNTYTITRTRSHMCTSLFAL